VHVVLYFDSQMFVLCSLCSLFLVISPAAITALVILVIGRPAVYVLIIVFSDMPNDHGLLVFSNTSRNVLVIVW
jgi:hypothetical protein